MPVGAIIGGVSGLAGAIIGGNKTGKAIDKAADAQAAAAQQAIALQKDIYNKNVGFQTPYLNTGNAAMAQMNALLGLNVPQAAPVSQGLPTNETQEPVGLNGPFANARLSAWRQRIANGFPIDDAPPWIQSALGGNQQAQTAGQPQTQVPTVTQPTAMAAYDAFKNYGGYQTRLNEGNNSLNSAYAAKGTLQSGAALQALAKYNQDYASNEFGKYFGYLSGQQQLGPGAANALSGVGTNYANAAGQIGLNQGDNIGNAAIAKANNFNNTMGNISNVFAQAMGSSFSDERLKWKIETIRVRSDGLPLKSWIYKNDPEQRRYEGFVAQDVAKVYPKAVIENFNGSGFLGVNYAEIPAEEGVAA
jgi:hypothetical protein